MGFFAVLSNGGDGLARPSVEKLDVNFWVLPGLFARTLFLCDIGILLRAGTEDLTKFTLAVPFRTEDGDCRDLMPRMVNSPLDFRLIFRTPLQSSPQGTQFFTDDQTTVRVHSLDGNETKRDTTNSTDNLSIWNVAIEGKVQAGDVGYLRLRLEVRGTGRLWTWVSTVKGRARAVIDFRVNDLREAVAAPINITWDQRVLPVKKLNAFVMVPAIWELRRIAPDPEYNRLLEGLVWEHHLDRAINLVRQSKLVVHRWKASDITLSDPFWGLMTLRRYTRINLPSLLTSVAVSVLTVFLVIGPSLLQDGFFLRAVEWLASYVAEHLPAAGLVASLLFIWQIIKYVRGAIPGMQSARRRLRHFERWIYRSRQHK